MMKKAWLILVICIFLCGCAPAELETMNDTDAVGVMAEPVEMKISFPEDATVLTMGNALSRYYFCKGYDVAVEITESGNLDATLKTITGYGKEELDMVETKRNGVACYEAVWTTVGEAGDCVGRLLVLDDNNYHYCVSAFSSAQNVASHADAWNNLFASVSLVEN